MSSLVLVTDADTESNYGCGPYQSLSLTPTLKTIMAVVSQTLVFVLFKAALGKTGASRIWSFSPLRFFSHEINGTHLMKTVASLFFLAKFQ